MVGPQYASVKQQLGSLLNGFISFESFVPEPTTNFPGIKEFLDRYKQKAVAAGVDALGYYLPPFLADDVRTSDERGDQRFGRCRTHIGAVPFSGLIYDGLHIASGNIGA